MPKKSSKIAPRGSSSAAALKISASWQVIASTGKGTQMNTVAESYAANGLLFQASPNQWRLKLGAVEVPVTFLYEASESVLFIERQDLLRVFDIELTEEDRAAFADQSNHSVPSPTEGVRLSLGKIPSRQMETIYRSPGEGLYLVKASIAQIK